MSGQRLANWVVIAVYFVSTAVAHRSLVLCREADGGTVIEIAGDHGYCLSTGEPGCDSCPCEDSSLAPDPARVVKRDPVPCGDRGSGRELLPWFAQPDYPNARPAEPRSRDGTAAIPDVTRRSLRAVVLLL